MSNKSLLFFIAACFCLVSASAQQTFTIKGRIKGLKDSIPIFLMMDNGSVLSTVEKGTIVNGVFSFTAKPEQEGVTKYALMADGDNFPSSWLDVWASPGADIKIDGEGYLFKNWRVSSNIPEQREAARYFAPSANEWKQWQEAVVERKQLRKKRPDAGPGEIKAAADSLNKAAQAWMDKIMDRELVTMERMPVTDIWMAKLRQAALSATYNHREAFRQKVIQLYNKLPENQRKSRAGVATRVYLYPVVVVKKGEPMADTVMTDLLGKTHRLTDYKGMYLLLDFWSVGCGPCIAAMPELDAIADSLSSRLKVISINMDEKRELWKKFLEKKTPATINLNDDMGMAGLAARYGVNGIPHYVMISPEGVIVDHWVGYEAKELTKRVKKFVE